MSGFPLDCFGSSPRSCDDTSYARGMEQAPIKICPSMASFNGSKEKVTGYQR
jgi:hypothetical protein